MKFNFHAQNSIAKINLKEGESFNYHFSEPTEEGYFSKGQTVELEGGILKTEITIHQSDCDGSYSSERDMVATELNEKGFPAWRVVDESQRDYAAEKAGY